tara:strand:+ start:11742 stop:15908 length:4167 start_codon:yes stop_codon:yes gene_type:complete
MSIKKLFNFIVLYIFLTSHSCWSQDNFPKYNFSPIKSGISKVGAYTIVQDNEGFIWLGTNGSGIYKYDGIDYDSYKYDLNDSTSVSSNLIYCSLLDSKKRLWFGTEQGINIYNRDTDNFIKIPLQPNASNENNPIAISALEEGNNGNILVGTYGQGVFSVDMKSLESKAITVVRSSEYGLLTLQAIKKDANGNIFAATNRGIFEFDEQKKLLKHKIFRSHDGIATIDLSIRSLHIDHQNTIWAGTFDSGLYRIKTEQKIEDELYNIELYTFSKNPFFSITALPNNTILCGTENDGLFHIDENGHIIHHYVNNKNDEKSILSNSIWSLLVDNNDKIWLSYYNKGVAVYDNLYDKFKDIESQYNKPNSLQIPSVSSIVKDHKGRLWVGTDGGGIDLIHPKNKQFTHINSSNNKEFSGLLSDYIPTLFIDSKQNLWAGSWDKGIFFLKKDTNHFVNYNTENTNGAIRSNGIMSFSESTDGTIWIAAYNNGLHSYDPISKQFTHYATESFINNGVQDGNAWKVLVDKKDNIWLGSTNGLFKIVKQNGVYTAVSMQERMITDNQNYVTSNTILSLYESSEGLLWIGTKGAGLCQYNPFKDTFSWFDKSNGLIQENICAITESLNGELWLGGNSGLTEFDLKNNSFKNFTMNDGLLSNDFNMNACLTDANGRIYFGGYQGINHFIPNEIITNRIESSVYLKELKIFNQKVNPTDKNSPLKKVITQTDSLTLTHKQSVFTIEYAGLNYTRPEENKYAYYLEGYENDWNYVGNIRSATYTNLDPGDYVFKLKASNNDGIWNKKPLDLYITILPPWWKTNWALLGYVAFFALGLYLLNKITQIRLKEKQIIHNEREKRIQEKDLNEKKFQFFTNISHEFRTPLTLIVNPLEDIIKDTTLDLPERVKDKHKTIYKNTDRLIRLINELLDFSKLEANNVKLQAQELNLVSFGKNIVSHFTEEAFIRNIHLSFDADANKISLWADIRMLEKIIFNVLSNAFKVTPSGGAITMEISSRDNLVSLPLINTQEPIKAIEISISDTGPGLEEEEIEKIFKRFYQVEHLNKNYYGGTGIGLEVVKSFVELHKGKIEVMSAPEKGTSFKIILPKYNLHLKEEELINNPQKEEKPKENILTKVSDTSSNLQEEHDKNSSSYTLLIVEDNTELQNYLKNELKGDYKVLTCSNGSTGLKMAKEVLPDIIITDVIMPQMDGLEFCKQIKTDLRTSHIPVLMLTAKARVDDRIEGIEIGADAYMVKPFNMRLLKLRLSQLVTSRQLIFNKYFSAISDVPSDGNTSSLDKEFIEKVLNYINEHLSNPDLGVESFATQLHLSRSQFYRKIKVLTNQTANEFIRNIRLQKAKQLIEKGNTNISEVCYTVGFSSPSYFTKCFKSYFDMLPTEVNT